MAWSAFKTPVASEGESFDLGGFRYTVKSHECGLAEFGERFSRETAVGEFCAFVIAAANTTDQTAAPNAEWILVAADGHKFTPHISFDRSLDDVFPGNAIEFPVAFDLPERTQPDHLIATDIFGGIVRDPRVKVDL